MNASNILKFIAKFAIDNALRTFGCALLMLACGWIWANPWTAAGFVLVNAIIQIAVLVQNYRAHKAKYDFIVQLREKLKAEGKNPEAANIIAEHLLRTGRPVKPFLDPPAPTPVKKENT